MMTDRSHLYSYFANDSMTQDDHGMTIRKLLDEWKLGSLQVSRFSSMVCDSRLFIFAKQILF